MFVKVIVLLIKEYKREKMASRYELDKDIVSISKQIEQLKLDNSIYQKFIDKKTVELGNDDDDKKKKKNKKNIATLLTPEQKCEVANVIHEEMLSEIETHRKNSEKMIDTLRAVLEEIEIRIGELKRDAYEFKRDIVVGAENARTGKIMAERVTKYFEDKLNMIDAIIEKLRLKNSSLKGQINKIETILSQKEEVGDALHYIDFHQLQIENKQYVAKIEERNEELLTVKVATGKTVQSLNEFKRKLNEKLDEADWLKKEIEDKKLNLGRLEKELGRVKTEVKSESRQKDTLRQQIEEAAEMPSIENYISQKREMYDFETSLKNWEKKVEIMEMAAKRSKVLVSKAKTYV